MTTRYYPPADHRIIPAGSNDPRITPVVVSIHVAVSLARSLFGWFNGPSGGIESHLYLRRDGTWEQYRQFDREADAQLGGNSWIAHPGTRAEKRLGSITIEMQGMGGGTISVKQRAALQAFALWAKDALDIPLRKVAEPNPGSTTEGGWGYHSLFARWNSMGKSCPGRRRIAWFNKTFVPWLGAQTKRYITVRSGDTIEELSARHRVSVETLWRLNRPRLAAGERLRIH